MLAGLQRPTEAHALYIALWQRNAFPDVAGSNFTNLMGSLGFEQENATRLSGARVLQIEGMDAYDYADFIADTVSGNYLDHGVRVNSAWTSYRLNNFTYSQRVGDIAGPVFTNLDNLMFTLIPVNATEPETVTVPFGLSFTCMTTWSDKTS